MSFQSPAQSLQPAEGRLAAHMQALLPAAPQADVAEKGLQQRSRSDSAPALSASAPALSALDSQN